MRQRDIKRIYQTIERKMNQDRPISQIVDLLCVQFDMSVQGAEYAIQSWEEQHDRKAA